MQNGEFNATVNDKLKFEHLDPADLDFVRTGSGSFHILHGNRSYHAELIEADYNNKSFNVKVNGSHYQVDLADRYDQLVKRLGLQLTAHHQVKDIKAPMPGLVLSLNVTEGQDVQKGDQLMILEAMKMENVIKSPGEGKVKKILVKQGAAVDKNQVMIEME